MSIYRLDVYNAAGAKQAAITDFTGLACVRRVNAPGLLTFTLPGEHPLVPLIGNDWQFELWRKPTGSVWAREFVGLHRYGRFDMGEQSVYTAMCPGLMSLLARRVVAWYAGTADRSAFVAAAAETIMKTIVGFNAASTALMINGRLRDGVVPGLSVQVDGGGGNALDWFCAYEPLLETLQKLALVSGGDFDVVKTTPTAWQFRWYAGQLGADRTATVRFGLNLGNMANPVYEVNRLDERTVAIVGGQGEAADRQIVVVTGPEYHVTNNNIEMFQNATDVETADGLTDRGNSVLKKHAAQTRFEFSVLQTPATAYGVHYFLGDLVTAVNPYTGADVSLKVSGVALSLDADGRETVDVEMMTP